MLVYLVKIIEILVFFFQNKKFGEYFCKMPPKKRSKRRCSQERERRSKQAQARSPEVDELSCVPETQQSQQAAGVEEVVVGVEDPLEMSDTEKGDIAHETQQVLYSNDEDIADTQDTQAAGGHRWPRARASQGPGRGNMYQKRRLAKEARNPLFCSVMRRSRN